MKQEKQPPTPDSRVLARYLQKWRKLENYKLQEQSLALLFQKLCPANRDIESVLLKVSALNDFYSTNIYDTYTVAKHILKKDIDDSLRCGDYELVNKLAKVTVKNGRKINFYSFASKYCSHHQPDVFPIYDYYVEKMLMHYRRIDKFDRFKKADLKNYKSFIKIIENFKTHYELTDFDLREIDIFLWLTGKKFFPKNYKN